MKRLERSLVKDRMETEIFNQFDLVRAVPAKKQRFGAKIDDQHAEEQARVEFCFLRARSAPGASHLKAAPPCNQRPQRQEEARPDEGIPKSLLKQSGVTAGGEQPKRRDERQHECQ